MLDSGQQSPNVHRATALALSPLLAVSITLAAAALIEIGGDVVPPKLELRTPPVYPEAARAARIEGKADFSHSSTRAGFPTGRETGADSSSRNGCAANPAPYCLKQPVVAVYPGGGMAGKASRGLPGARPFTEPRDASDEPSERSERRRERVRVPEG